MSSSTAQVEFRLSNLIFLIHNLKIHFLSDWNNLVVGKISPYINLDHEDKSVRLQSEKTLEQELAFAGHLALPAVMISLRQKNINLARCLHNKVVSAPANLARFHVWVHLPMVSPASEAAFYEREPLEEDSDTPWHWWNRFRCLANSEKRLGVALEMTADLPDEAAINRWLGEPVRCLILPTHLFMANKKGFPVLSKPHQNIVRQFLRQKAQILITGAQRHNTYRHYQQYMDHLWQVE